MGISSCCLNPEGSFVKIMCSVSSIPGESMGRLLGLWLLLILLPHLCWKGGGQGTERAYHGSFHTGKWKATQAKGGLKENIFLLVTGSCFEDKFDSLSRSEITSSLEHVFFCVWSRYLCLSISEGSFACTAWSHPQIVFISLEIKKKVLFCLSWHHFTLAKVLLWFSAGRIWPVFVVSTSVVLFSCL